jgi:uncharacterized protein
LNSQKPTAQSQRIVLLDIYRGFAILGIFVVNIGAMNSSYFSQEVFAAKWTSPLDQIVELILQLFFYTKFFPIFSLLFGLGISMQAIRLSEKGLLNFSFFGRRMGFLFLIGLLHITFLFSGDVLNIYAILGLLITILINKSNKLILTLAFILLLFPFYDQVLGEILKFFNFDPGIFLADYTPQKVNEIIRSGSYVDSIKFRWLEYMYNIPLLFGFFAPMALAMFLLGLYLGKNKIYEKLDSFIFQIRKPMLWITLFTCLYRLLFLFVFTGWDIYRTEVGRTVFIKLMVLSDIQFGMFYLWLLGWVWYHTHWQKILSPLQYVGRMALTNYIFQSLVGLVLFSSVGFGLYESMSPFQTLATAFGVFIFQIFLSKIWFNYFKSGPLEWIWRRFTYK